MTKDKIYCLANGTVAIRSLLSGRDGGGLYHGFSSWEQASEFANQNDADVIIASRKKGEVFFKEKGFASGGFTSEYSQWIPEDGGPVASFWDDSTGEYITLAVFVNEDDD
jgi:hypothetical protein